VAWIINSVGLWLGRVRRLLAAFNRFLLLALLLTLLAGGLFALSAWLDAADKWFIAKIVNRLAPPEMDEKIVLVHVDKRSAVEGRQNSYHDRAAVALLLSILAGKAPEAIVLDMTFEVGRIDDRSSNKAICENQTPQPQGNDGFNEISCVIQALAKGTGGIKLYAQLDPFHHNENNIEIVYFLSSEPWFRDLKLPDGPGGVQYGQTAFALNDDCSVAVFWPAVNPITHPMPKNEAPKNFGPFADVAALLVQIARPAAALAPYAPRYFLPGPAEGTKAKKMAFDFENKRLMWFDAEKKFGLGGEASFGSLKDSIVLVGDMVHDKFQGKSCEVPGIELIGWGLSELWKPQPSNVSALLNSTNPAVSALVLIICMLLTYRLVERRTKSTQRTYPALRTMWWAILAGSVPLVLLCAVLSTVFKTFPGLTLPLATIFGAGVIWTWYLHRAHSEQTDIFISYKHKDAPGLALKLFLNLRTIELDGRYANVFLDLFGLKPSQDWEKKVAKHIYECKMFVPILSKQYVDEVHKHPDKPCALEVAYAMKRLEAEEKLEDNQKKFAIYPIFVEDVNEIPDDHSGLHKLKKLLGVAVKKDGFSLSDLRRTVRELIRRLK
jgi:hypothetical protein